MEVLCPDCDSKLTPSIVGYLCHDCGNVHSFEKIASARSHNIGGSIKKSASTTQLNQKSSHLIEIVHRPAKKRFRHKIKDFVVPKIAETHNQKK